jgi:hypothetical protein
MALDTARAKVFDGKLVADLNGVVVSLMADRPPDRYVRHDESAAGDAR